jgi:hypothetical protein
MAPPNSSDVAPIKHQDQWGKAHGATFGAFGKTSISTFWPGQCFFACMYSEGNTMRMIPIILRNATPATNGG